MVKTVPLKYIMRKHNMERYIVENLEPKLHFLQVLPTANTDTGEFSTILTKRTAAQDLDDEILSEPLPVAEASELTKINISPITKQLGNTTAVGYQFEVTQKFLNKADAEADINNALKKIAAGMTIKINDIILTNLLANANVTPPADLSNWDDEDEIDPRGDGIKLRNGFRTNNRAFTFNTMYLSNARFMQLEDYMMSIDKPFDSEQINLDGTMVRNVDQSFDDDASVDFLGMDSNVPPGVIQKYVDPKFSYLRQAELQGRTDLPDSLIQVHNWTMEDPPFDEKWAIWAELGYSNREPDGLMSGELGP